MWAVTAAVAAAAAAKGSHQTLATYKNLKGVWDFELSSKNPRQLSLLLLMPDNSGYSTPNSSDENTPLFDENTTPQSLRRVCTIFIYLVMQVV
jgi:hypothetical protein